MSESSLSLLTPSIMTNAANVSMESSTPSVTIGSTSTQSTNNSLNVNGSEVVSGNLIVETGGKIFCTNDGGQNHVLACLGEYTDGEQLEIGNESAALCLNHREVSGWSDSHIKVSYKDTDNVEHNEKLAYLTDVTGGSSSGNITTPNVPGGYSESIGITTGDGNFTGSVYIQTGAADTQGGRGGINLSGYNVSMSVPNQVQMTADSKVYFSTPMISWSRMGSNVEVTFDGDGLKFYTGAWGTTLLPWKSGALTTPSTTWGQGKATGRNMFSKPTYIATYKSTMSASSSTSVDSDTTKIPISYGGYYQINSADIYYAIPSVDNSVKIALLQNPNGMGLTLQPTGYDGTYWLWVEYILTTDS
jgi:hypothetical protein